MLALEQAGVRGGVFCEIFELFESLISVLNQSKQDKRMAIEGTASLTSQQISSMSHNCFDLASGYPLISQSPDVLSLYKFSLDEASSLSARFGLIEAKNKSRHKLIEAAENFLKLPRDWYYSIEPVLTGSLAINRVLIAMRGIAARNRKKKVHVVTSSPSIDIVKEFIEENRDFGVSYLSCSQALDLPSVSEFIDSVEKLPSDVHPVIYITSPENPTGKIWSAQAISRLENYCGDNGITLIIDQCFLYAGVHTHSDIPKAWECKHNGCDLIVIWDTGKTFSLAGDKLAFVICSTKVLAVEFVRALLVVQYDISLISTVFFTNFFNSPLSNLEMERLRKLCVDNLSHIEAMFLNGCELVKSSSSSLLLVDISKTGLSSREIRDGLEAAGLGVITCEVFFHTGEPMNRYIRISLGRDSDYFVHALEKMAIYFNNSVKGLSEASV